MRDRIPVRVLVIDDEEKVCRRLAAWLQAEAYEVATFVDQKAGVEHAHCTPCDIALVDLRLPDADGADVIASLRELSSHTRIVAMCAFPEAEQIRRALQAGAGELLEKPIDRGPLLLAIQRQLAHVGILGRSEPEFNRRLGSRLRELRTQAGRTQNHVAESVGITSAQLSQIELGKTATSTWTLARLAGSLRVPLGTVFNGL